MLSIQSSVAFGRVGNRAAVFALERLGHEVWPVDTVSFSNHPAYGAWRGRVRPAAEVGEILEGIAERGALARCDAVLSGYLGDPATAPLVLDIVTRARAARPGVLYCCDPVIGEVGRGVYVRPGLPELFRDRLVPAADVVTPNPFELAYLAGRPAGTVATLGDALAAADAVRGLGPALVVATGLRFDEAPGEVAALATDAGGAWLCRAPWREVTAHGAGDAFTALLLGAFLGTRDAAAALGHAVSALDAVLARTAAAGAGELALVAAQDALVSPPVLYPVQRLR